MGLPYFDYCQKLEQKLRIEEPLMEQAGRWIATQIHRGGCLHIFASRTLQGTAYEFWQQCPRIDPRSLIKHPQRGYMKNWKELAKQSLNKSMRNPKIFFFLIK